MTKGMTVAYACAKKVAEKLPENKRKSYRQMVDKFTCTERL